MLETLDRGRLFRPRVGQPLGELAGGFLVALLRTQARAAGVRQLAPRGGHLLARQPFERLRCRRELRVEIGRFEPALA